MHVPVSILTYSRSRDELAEATRQSYVGINQVLVLKKFINWSASIDPYLSDAAKTDGVSGFCMFLVSYSSSVL